MDIGKVLDFGYAFSTPDVAFGPLSTIYFVVFVIVCLISNYLYFDGKYRFFSKNRATFTLVNRFSRRAAIVSSIGVFFFLCRLIGLQPLNARIFLDATLVVGVIWLVQGVIWFSRTYPKVKAEWRDLQGRQRIKQERERPSERPAVASVAVKPAAVAASADAGDGNDSDERQATIREALENQARSRRGEKRRAKKR